MSERQNATNGDGSKWELTPQQAAAVDLLAAGRTVTETAEAIGVARQTVSEWLNQHFGIRAELNRRRQELWNAMTERLRTLVPKALEVVASELESENPLPAAVQVLKACGLYGVTWPLGSTDSAELETAARRRSEELAIAARERTEELEIATRERHQARQRRALLASMA